MLAQLRSRGFNSSRILMKVDWWFDQFQLRMISVIQFVERIEVEKAADKETEMQQIETKKRTAPHT